MVGHAHPTKKEASEHRSGPGHQLIDLAVEREEVELAGAVLAEAGDVQLRLRRDLDQLAVGHGLAVLLAETPDPARVVVAVDVDAGQLGQGLAAVDVAPRDALAVVAAPR